MIVRRFSLAVAFITLMLAIWCLTPPQTSTACKIICTTLVICLYAIGLLIKKIPKKSNLLQHLRDFRHACASSFGYIVRVCGKGIASFFRLLSYPFVALGRLIKKIFTSKPIRTAFYFCFEKLEQFLDFLDQHTQKFISWTFQADLDDVTEGRNRALRQFGHHKQPRHPLCRVNRCLEFVALLYFITTSLISLIICYHHAAFALIIFITINLYIVAYFFFNIFTHATTLNMSTRYQPVDPCLSPAVVICQIFLLCVELFVLFLIKTSVISDQFGDAAFFNPYFTLDLRFTSFTLSPIQATIIASAVLLLVSYGYLCVAVHDMARLPESTS